MDTQTFVRQVVTDSTGRGIGTIFDVYKDGQRHGSFFAQWREVPRGACVNFGINSNYLPQRGGEA